MTYHRPFPRSLTIAPALSFAPVDDAYVALTLRLGDPSSDLALRHIALLRDCVALAQKYFCFAVEAAVVLPAQLQMLCRFEGLNPPIDRVAQMIHSTFLRHLPQTAGPMISSGALQAWRDDVDILPISAAAAALRRRFIEGAAVRAGLVRVAHDWPYSSAHPDISERNISQRSDAERHTAERQRDARPVTGPALSLVGPVKTIAPVPSVQDPAIAGCASQTGQNCAI